MKEFSLRISETNKSHLLVFFLTLFAGFLHCGKFLSEGTLYWDTAKIFTQFRDNLQALNTYNEFALWFPHTQTGSPGYYHSILGIPSALNPAFVLIAIPVWLLGRLGIIIQRFQPLYVFYFGFLIPGFFLFSVRAFASRLFRSPQVQAWIVILCAFSPAVTFHITDIGFLEPTAYGLLFAAFLLDFLKQGTTKAYWKLVFSTLLITISFNLAALYWNFFFIPFFLSVVLFPRNRAGLKRLCGNLRGIPTRFHLCSLLLVLSCLLPQMLTYSQGKELVRSSLGMQKVYPFERLAHGNPLEALIVSIPGFGFDWDSARENWTLMLMSNEYHTSHYYLGILCLAMALFGFLFGNRILRKWLLIGLGVSFSAIILSAHSPLMASLLWMPSPLRSCNHLSDAFFKSGGFLFLVFASALGLKSFLRFKNPHRQHFISFFFITILLGISTHFFISGMKILGDTHFGLLLFFSFLFFILSLWILRAKTLREMNAYTTILLFFVFVDVSTQSFLYVRYLWNSKVTLNSGWPAYSKIDETPAKDGIGIEAGKDRHYYTNILLMYPAYFQMALNKFPIESIPEYSFFTDLDKMNLQLPPPLQATESVQVVEKTFNKRNLIVKTPISQFFFVRDAFSPYWSVKVNGKSAEIARAFHNYKAVIVPAGVSRIEFTFAPPGITWSILLAYFAILGSLAAGSINGIGWANRHQLWFLRDRVLGDRIRS